MLRIEGSRRGCATPQPIHTPNLRISIGPGWPHRYLGPSWPHVGPLWPYTGPMKKLNLRMTDEQHAELERWAAASNRSLQREVIHRLFHARTQPVVPRSELASADAEDRSVKGRMIEGSGVAGVAAPSPVASAGRDDRVTAPELPAVSSARAAERAKDIIHTPGDVPAVLLELQADSDREFKPDFKAPAEKKKGRR